MDPNQSNKTQTPAKKASIPVPTSKFPSSIPAPGTTGLKRPSPISIQPPPPSSLVNSSSTTDVRQKPPSLMHPPTPVTTKLPVSTSDATSKEPIRPSASIPSIANLADRRLSSTNEIQRVKSIENATSIPTTPIVKQASQIVAETTEAANSGNGSDLAKENENLKMKIKDLEEKLDTLKAKRAEDRDKVRELDKSKIQLQQLQEFKSKAQKEISDLNKELVQTKQESKVYKEQYEQYKDEMNNHEQRIEEITVDKELAEAKIEEQQEEINKLNDKIEEIQLELDVLKGEIEVNGTSGATDSYQLKQAEKEQERLKSALIKLRDLSLQDKSEVNTLRKQNEDYLAKINKLTKEADSLKNENTSNMAQIVDLKDQVTATLGSVQMIEQLTETNLNLETKIEELEAQVADLESINEVDNQLIESAKEEEKELRENLDLAESRIREFERQIESLKYNIADHEKTILKFREVVKQLQMENDKINRQYQSKLEDEKTTNATVQQSANYDFKTKFIEYKNYAKIIENEANKIEIQNLRRHVNYLLQFMNEQFLKRGGDNECILTILLFKRLISKSDLILKEAKEKFPVVEQRLNKEEVLKTNKADQMSFLHEISMLLSFIQLYSSRFDSALSVCGLNKYTNIGSMYFDLNIQEKSLDGLIELLQKNQFDEGTNLEALEKACNYLSNVYKNHLNEELFDSCLLINDLVKFCSSSCELITVEIHRLQSITQIKDTDTCEILMLFKEIFNLNEEIKLSIKKLNRFIPKDEKKRLMFSQSMIAKIDELIKHVYKLAKFLHLMSYESTSTLSMFPSDDGLSSKKLEDLAYQVCDKVFLNDDSGPYETIRNSLQDANDILNELSDSLENGVYEKAINEEELKINAPVTLASEIFKNMLIEADGLKYKIEAKEEEIKEIKKHLKFKSDELSENKVRLSIMEKKYETAQKEGEEKSNKLQHDIEDLKASIAKNEKEHTETLEALQQELDALQNEKRDLKEKIRQFTKRNLIEGIMTKSSAEQSPSSDRTTSMADSLALVEEIKLLKNTIKLLEDRNAELRIENAKVLLNNLPNLEKAKKPLNLITQTSRDNNEQVSNVYKESNQLLKELYSSLTSIKIPEIKGNSIDEVNNKKFLLDLQTNIQMNSLSKKRNQLEKTLTKLQSNIIPGSCVKTSLNTFQAPEFNTNKSVSNTNSILVAEIAIPCAKGSERQFDLFLNNKDIHEIFKTVSIA